MFDSFDAISIDTLHEHFRGKFSVQEENRAGALDESAFVHQKMRTLSANPMNSIVLAERRTVRLMKALRTGCSAGVDGISAEHLKYAIGSSLPLHLSVMLTLCLRHGCLPDVFYMGLVTPILKKPNLDPSKPQFYRPITVSVSMSKLLVLEECNHFEAHACQFGFVAHRGTNTAISLVNDVSAYCVARGSSVYLCMLDAEGAFDCLPHDILFKKAADVMPDHCWRVIFQWYSRMTASIQWSGSISQPMPVTRGTRQGGLTSPLLFNMFYKELIIRLDAKDCGINIKGISYNVFCYADDILLASTTPTGLQSLIDHETVSCIMQNGLRFNTAKTLCTTLGKASLTPPPSWTIGGCSLSQTDVLTYLGVQWPGSCSTPMPSSPESVLRTAGCWPSLPWHRTERRCPYVLCWSPYCSDVRV